MSIFDFPEFVPDKKEYPQIIEYLRKDILQLFDSDLMEDESYEVWEHVKNLGKRYCVWIANVHHIDAEKMQQVIDKYKWFHLEVSFNASPELGEGYSGQNIMCSTMWTTVKHEEIDIELNAAEKHFLTTGKNDYWQNARRSYPCDDCIWWKDDCALGIDSRKEFCKKHKSKNLKCNRCFHEYEGKCGCNSSEYFEKNLPVDGCRYYDEC